MAYTDRIPSLKVDSFPVEVLVHSPNKGKALTFHRRVLVYLYFHID